MRVSNKQLLDSSILAMQQQATDALKYQRQIASGNRFAKASEGAVELAQGVALQFEKSRYEMLKTNQNVVALRMGLAYTTLDTMSSLLFNLKEIAARATFPGLDASSLDALHTEAEVAYNAFKDLAESTDGSGDPIFLADYTNTPDAGAVGGGDVSQDTASSLIELEIEPGVFLAQGLGEREVLGIKLVDPLVAGNTEAAGKSPFSPAPVFTGYIASNYAGLREQVANVKLFLDSLGAMTTPGTPNQTTALDLAIDHILKMRTRAGSLAAQVDIARSSLESKAIEVDGAKARLLETDIAEASTKLVRAQTLLEAARSVFSRLEASNLFQRLL